MDRERAAAFAVRLLGDELHLHRLVAENDRRVERQLLDAFAADLPSRGQGHIHQRRAGDHHPVEQHVIGHPRMRRLRQAAGEHPLVLARNAQLAAEHGVPRGAQAERRRVARTGGPVEPVALALERVGGEIDEPSALEELRPVDLDAVRVRLAQEAHQRLGLLAATPHRRRGEDVLDRLLHERAQNAVRSELEEARDTVLLELPDAIGEADRVAHLPHPVVRIGHVPAGDDRDLRLVERQAPRHLAELVQHRLHQVRVERVAHLQPLPAQLLHRLRVAGHDDRIRGVDRRHLDAVRKLVGQLRELRHRAALRQRRHQPPARLHQRTRVLERQHTGNMRGRQLADRMADQEVRPHPERLDQPVERHLELEQAALRTIRTRQLLIAELDQRRVEQLREQRERLAELATHTGPLRPLPGEHERRLARPHTALDKRLADKSSAVLESRPPRREREADVEQRQIGMRREMRTQPLDLRRKSRLRPRRDQQRHRESRMSAVGCRLGQTSRRLLEDDVSVGAGDAERRHAGAARPLSRLPRSRLGQQLHLARRPVDVRRGLVDVQRPRQLAVAHGHDHLDHARHTGGRLRMADVRLDRPEPQRAVSTVAAVRVEESLRLDRVPQRRAGAVALHRVQVARRQASARERSPDHPFLRRPVRRREPVRRAVLVRRASAHERQHLVPVALGLGQRLEHQEPGALGPARSVGGSRERLAPAVRREPALPAELDEHRGRGHHGDAAGERQRALPLAKRLAGEMQGDERRRARRVHRDRRPLEPERVRDPARDDARQAPGEPEALGVVPPAAWQRRVVLEADPREHTRLATTQRLETLTKSVTD